MVCLSGWTDAPDVLPATDVAAGPEEDGKKETNMKKGTQEQTYVAGAYIPVSDNDPDTFRMGSAIEVAAYECRKAVKHLRQTEEFLRGDTPEIRAIASATLKSVRALARLLKCEAGRPPASPTEIARVTVAEQPETEGKK